MVRSGHHRKRSRSRSITPDHKRNKSSRDYDKDRLRRRSRSRERLRRSRSRDRKKDKKILESRVRSKPLKLKRRSRSRSRSRSKSKDRTSKKDEKKDSKVEEEPFDPTNLDKGGDEDEWVVTDVVEDLTTEDNGILEEEYDYEADEDDQYSHTSSTSHINSHHTSPDRTNQECEANKEDKEQNEKSSNNGDLSVRDEIITEEENDVLDVDENSSVKNDEQASDDKNRMSSERKENRDDRNSVEKGIKNVVSKLKESSSVHKQNMKVSYAKHEADELNLRSHSYYRSSSNSQHADVVRYTKDHLRQCMKLDKELHELRVKHEIARHKAEMEVIRLQLNYWKSKR